MANRQGQKKQPDEGVIKVRHIKYDASFDNDVPEQVPQGISLQTLSHILYGLFAAGLVSGGMLGVAILAAVVLAYLKRDDAATTPWAGHIDWVLKTFWWGLLWSALSVLLLGIYIGWLTGLLTLLWLLYRVARGWLALCEGNSPTVPDA